MFTVQILPIRKKELMVDLNSLQMEQITIVFCNVFTKQNAKKKIMRLICPNNLRIEMRNEIIYLKSYEQKYTGHFTLTLTKIDWMKKHLRDKEPFICQYKFLQNYNFINNTIKT